MTVALSIHTVKGADLALFGNKLYAIYLFVFSFSSNSRIFNSHGEVTIADEGLQILTYARHSWPLSSESSLACHTYCHMGHSSYSRTLDISSGEDF